MDRVEAEAIYDSGREVCVEFILELAGRVEQHEDRLKRLEEQARQDSRTSSRPPSTDPPKTRAQRRAEARAKAKELMRRDGERRKAGGQSGHRGAGRELRPSDQVDEIVDHFPGVCGVCERPFAGEQQRSGGRFGRRQVAELPPISVTVVEHRTHQLRCRSCRARTSARLPEAIGASAFGPRLQAAMVTLTAAYRVSRRGITELARDLFGVALSTGAADAICQRASDALAGPHLQLQDWVLDQAAVHVDETGWRTSGEGRALWTATTPQATFLQIAEHCNREQFNTLIGTGYPGIVISDRWNGYSHLDPNRRQACWSHIQRDFCRHADGLGEQKPFGEHGLELTRRVFHGWRAYQHEHHDRQRLQNELAPVQAELRQLLDAASPKSKRTRWHRQFANNLLKIWPALWTFTTTDGVQPTNYSEVWVMPMLAEKRPSSWVQSLAEFGIIRALRGTRAACLVGGSGRVWCGVGRCGRALVA
ncbi:MAG: IS66 family transposase [Actinomycetota bacterium]|nr:IS66 family transposase [Actinomycetota bacterium]